MLYCTTVNERVMEERTDAGKEICRKGVMQEGGIQDCIVMQESSLQRLQHFLLQFISLTRENSHYGKENS